MREREREKGRQQFTHVTQFVQFTHVTQYTHVTWFTHVTQKLSQNQLTHDTRKMLRVRRLHRLGNIHACHTGLLRIHAVYVDCVNSICVYACCHVTHGAVC